MKKFYVLALAAMTLLAGCKKDSATLPSVSFETAVPTTVDGTSVLSISASDYTGTEAVTVPVKFAGDAVKGTDYTVSAEAFVIGGASPVTSIVVTPVDYTSKKTVKASLELPEGFTAGKYVTSEFALSGPVGVISFSSKRGLLTAAAVISADVLTADGSTLLPLQNGDEIAVSVNTEKSTAVEGTDFKFKNDKKAIVIEPMKSSGSVELEYIGSETVEGNKTIVLDIALNGKYSGGQYISTTIEVLGSYWNMLGGKWVINELLTDATFFSAMWGDGCSNYDLLPALTSSDSFEIDLETGVFKPAFDSAFKNYFLGEANMTKGDEVTYRSGLGLGKTTVQTFILDNVNRYFSETEKSEDKEGYIGARIIDGDNGEKLLELHVFDHTSKSFMPELPDYNIYGTEKPVAAAYSHSAIIATFKKAK